MENNLKIGIIGLGMVGGALDNYFSKLGFNVYRKDLDLDEGINQADIIFIAVPTPYDANLKGYDLSAIIENLQMIDDGKIVVIKSTVTPGTTRFLQQEFPNLKILFNPEFLTEATTDNDFENPDRQIIGYTDHSRDVADLLLNILPQADYVKIMPAEEAEMIKLATNAYMSTKVIFFNQIYDLCQKNNLDYDLVREGVNADWRIGPSHSDVWHGGFRGFAGKCLPKDLNALIAYAENIDDLKFRAEIFKLVREINDYLVNSSK